MIREVDTSLSDITSAMVDRQKKYEKGAEKLAGVREVCDTIESVVTDNNDNDDNDTASQCSSVRSHRSVASSSAGSSRSQSPVVIRNRQHRNREQVSRARI